MADDNDRRWGATPGSPMRPAGANAPRPGATPTPAITASSGPSVGLPSLSAPKGGGDIRGIGEKLSTNLATGTASLSVPIATSPGRSDFELHLGLSYDSGAGNGTFGIGWHCSVPAITRKTDKGLPRYLDAEESDACSRGSSSGRRRPRASSTGGSLPTTTWFLGMVRNSAGEFVNPAGDKSLGWSSHQVVVKAGKVYDALTGPKGMATADYKQLWEYGDALSFVL